MKFQRVLSQATVLGVASAHSIFTYFEAEGTTYPASYGLRDPTYDGPINDVTTDYMACNGGPNPTTASPYVITVKAGDTVNAIWRHTLTSTEENDSIYVIDPSHKGPTLAYMKKVDDALTDDGIGDGWFKVEAAGLTNVATQDWATTDLIANQGNQSITIPTCIESGQYLLRAELIALHAASATLGAQFYMECAQLNVTGGTGTATPSTVAFPGAYGQSDPGILINIYQTLTTYTIPGPTPFVCGAGGSSPTTASSSASSTKAISTTLTTSVKSSTTTSTSTVATSTATSGTGSPLYGQCGGTGWTGPTTCASGTCTFSSAYYSQCLAA